MIPCQNYKRLYDGYVTYYFHPQFSSFDLSVIRGPGAGFGNLLFPLARALGYARTHKGILVEPTWRNLKLGPFLRFERDKRTYGNLFVHRSLSQIFGDISRRSLTRRRITEEIFLNDFTAGTNCCTLVSINGMRNRFRDIAGVGAVLREWLLTRIIICPKQMQVPFVALHVRLGDFGPALDSYKRNTRIEFEWFRDEAIRVNKLLGEMPIYVFSDEDCPRLRSVLDGIPNIKFLKPVNAAHDLLYMSNAKHIIASNSTFSLWAAFIGTGTISSRFGELFTDYGLDDPDFIQRIC